MTSFVLALVSVLLGGTVLAGWATHSDSLTSIIETWATMKPLTATLFIISGALVASFPFINSRIGEVAVSMLTLCLLLTIGFNIIAHLSEVSFWNLFFPYQDNGVMLVRGGEPSIVTTLAFTLVGIAGLIKVFNGNGMINKLGLFVYLIGMFCLIGYLIQIPFLFFYVAGVSGAMAFHTGFGFLLLGSALILSRSLRFKRRHHS